MTKKLLTETLTATQPEALQQPGRWRVRIIDAGMGSSGYYPAATLEAAVADRVWPAGTHVYLDHPGANESTDRPERSLRDLVGVLESDAHWDPATQAAEAVVNIYSPYRALLAEMAGDIGMSIRAYGTAETGEVDGQRVPVVTQLLACESVDFVTKPGRGGKVLEILESARKSTLSEASAGDVRDRLRRALDAAYPPNEYGDHRAWLQDFDPDQLVAWYEHERRTWEQSYILTDHGAELTGQRVEVRPVTVFQPVTAEPAPAIEATPVVHITNGHIDPHQIREAITATYRRLAPEPPTAAASAPAEPTQKESLVDTVTIPAAELTQLRESITKAEQTATELAEARAKLAERDAELTEARKATAQALVAKAVAESTLPTAAKARITAQFAESAEVTAEQVTDAITAELAYIESIATIKVAAPLGFGGSVTESHTTHRVSPWGTQTKES